MTIRWPWVSAARLDDLLREKDTALARAEKQIADLEKERKRLYDLVFMGQFGVQVHDSIPQPQAEPEPQLTPEQSAEKELLEQAARDEMRLRSIAKTNPSQLGAEIARMRRSSTIMAAEAANPGAQAFVAELKTIETNGHNAN